MADPRYQVFVSSTYTDLVEERQAVMSALLQLGAMPAGMELFPAADDEAWVLIQRVIDESDYYLLIVGGRYGSVTDEGLSFTEKEYDYAVAQGKPVMAFIHGRPDEIPVGKSDVDAEAREKLGKFVAKVKKAKHVKMWASAEDLAGKIALSFTNFVRSYPAPGWVRGDAGDSPETLRRLADAQLQLAELEKVAQARGSQPPSGAEGLAADDELLSVLFQASVEVTNLKDRTYAAEKMFAPWVESEITWNEILADMGPSMVHEARQDKLEKRFDNALWRSCYEDIEKQAREHLREMVPLSALQPGGDPGIEHAFRVTEVDCQTSDFETVLVQLQGLGLIEQSDQRRAVADRGTYWTLTPWGRYRLTQLRAVRKGETRPSSEMVEEGSD